MQNQQLIEKVIKINRVAKVTKGGKKLSFCALVVVGDAKGAIGFGLGKSGEVANAINKGISRARKDMFNIPLHNDTIPYQMMCDYGAAKILLKPATKGTGIIAGGPIRAICEVAGIKDIVAKSLGSNNPVNVIRAAVKGFKSIEPKDELS